MFQPTRIVEVIAGTALKATWTNSGTLPSSLQSTLLGPGDSVISDFNALSMGNSGNGHFFAVHHVPTSYPWYVNRWFSFIDGSTYQHRQLIRAHKVEV